MNEIPNTLFKHLSKIEVLQKRLKTILKNLVSYKKSFIK